jgi:hypothetical protein
MHLCPAVLIVEEDTIELMVAFEFGIGDFNEEIVAERNARQPWLIIFEQQSAGRRGRTNRVPSQRATASRSGRRSAAIKQSPHFTEARI